MDLVMVKPLHTVSRMGLRADAMGHHEKELPRGRSPGDHKLLSPLALSTLLECVSTEL